jgi:uncharacterized protein YecE (DUF72 family)
MNNRIGQAALFIGCAGWTIPKEHQPQFPTDGSHLARYAGRFSAVEINSSFYKSHRPATYARWADSVPSAFRFAVKVPKAITHVARLVGVKEHLAAFLNDVRCLNGKIGPLLVQLPPSLDFNRTLADKFFAAFRRHFNGSIVCEPRHASWFSAEGWALLNRFRVARVAADPATVPAAAEPGGWPDLAYYRLHGSPKMYYSTYSDRWLAVQAKRLQSAGNACSQIWCIFDNTAAGAATANALALISALGRHSSKAADI